MRWWTTIINNVSLWGATLVLNATDDHSTLKPMDIWPPCEIELSSSHALRRGCLYRPVHHAIPQAHSNPIGQSISSASGSVWNVSLRDRLTVSPRPEKFCPRQLEPPS
jgi:hypothetical protein